MTDPHSSKVLAPKLLFFYVLAVTYVTCERLKIGYADDDRKSESKREMEGLLLC